MLLGIEGGFSLVIVVITAITVLEAELFKTFKQNTFTGVKGRLTFCVRFGI